jgi:hypothetical protein
MLRAICGEYIELWDNPLCTENTMESRSAISNIFHNDIEERNLSQFKTRRRRPERTPVSVSSPMYNVSY